MSGGAADDKEQNKQPTGEDGESREERGGVSGELEGKGMSGQSADEEGQGAQQARKDGEGRAERGGTSSKREGEGQDGVRTEGGTEQDEKDKRNK